MAKKPFGWQNGKKSRLKMMKRSLSQSNKRTISFIFERDTTDLASAFVQARDLFEHSLNRQCISEMFKLVMHDMHNN
jgi:hypothetical protein